MGEGESMKKAYWFVLGSVLAVGTLVFLGSGAFAQSAANPDTELKTAISHAGYAAKADAIGGVTQHLHHVLNCLVGPQDKLFDQAAGNPCKGQGNGLLPDLKAKGTEDGQYYEASWAAEVAGQGVASKNLQEAKTAAHVAGLILADAAKAK